MSGTELQKAFEQDIRDAWLEDRRDRSDQNPYALIMYGVEGAEVAELFPAILTKECLTETANKYVNNGHYDTTDEARERLQFNVPDDPGGFIFECRMPAVESVVSAMDDNRCDSGLPWTVMIETAAQALMALDKQGLFGEGEARDQLLVLVDIAGSNDAVETAERLNSAAAFQKFPRCEGVYKSCKDFNVSADNKFVIAGITIGDNDFPGGFVHETTLFSIDDDELTSVWTHRTDKTRARVVGTAVSEDSDYFWVATSFAEDNVVACIIQCHSAESSVPVTEKVIATAPEALAVSHDGSRVALLTSEETVLFFDSALEELQQVSTGVSGYGLRFLRNGDVLVATKEKMLHITADYQLKPTKVSEVTECLDFTTSENRLVVGRLYGREEHSLSVYDMNTMDLLNVISYPDHQLTSPCLSASGKYVVCQAYRSRGYRYYAVVFDIDSGEPVGQPVEKYPFSSSIHGKYLNDDERLIISASDITSGHPFVLKRQSLT